jgi:hypothetical protein
MLCIYIHRLNTLPPMVRFLVIVSLPHLRFQHLTHEPRNGSVLLGSLLPGPMRDFLGKCDGDIF